MKNTTDSQTATAPAVVSSDWLGASGFVFLDDRPWPYLVRENSDGWWLYYWSHGNKNFVTMRKLTVEEAERFRPHALSPEKAALYAPNGELCSGGDKKQ